MGPGFYPKPPVVRPPSHHHSDEYDDYDQYWIDHDEPEYDDDLYDYEPELEWEDLGS